MNEREYFNYISDNIKTRKYGDLLNKLERYFSIYSPFLVQVYLRTNLPREVRRRGSDSKFISEISFLITNEKYEEIRNNFPSIDISDDEFKILSAYIIAQNIKQDVNRRYAASQGEEYSNDARKVEYYGSRARAFNHGERKYLDEHNSRGFEFLESIVTLAFQEQQKGRTL